MTDTSENTTDLEFEDEQVETHAAYVLGRNIWMIEGWLENVHAIAQYPGRPWEWSEQQRLFGESFEVPPFDWNDGISDALLTLVEARVVDAGILVELHRELDAAFSQSELITGLIRNNLRSEICETYWEAAAHLARAIPLAESLLARATEPYRAWQMFGSLLGRLRCFLGNDFDPVDFLDLFDRLIEVGQRLLSLTDMNEIAQVRESVMTTAQSRRITIESIHALNRLDQVATEALRLEIKLQDPYIVLDDIREEIRFLGSTISFQKFRNESAMGGVTILRTAMHSPGEFVSAKKVLDIEIGQLYSYMSRFKRVVRSTEIHWPAGFRKGEKWRCARDAFIVTKSKSRGRFERKSGLEGPEYKLDLQPGQFSHVG